jgi:probable addiction module antidote protein
MAPIRLKKGVHLQEHNPDEFFMDRSKVRDALIQSIFEGDVSAFKEILAAHLRTLSKDDLSKKTGISRATVFRIIDQKSNPSFANVAKILKTLKLAG